MVTLGKIRHELPVLGLTHCTPKNKKLRKEISPIAFSPKPSPNRSGSSAVIHVQPDFKAEQQHSSRKQRRYLSNELHRLFVSALRQLGGRKLVATPKQNRELMQVNGLTKDEVKSYLQKYHLHSRRPPRMPLSYWLIDGQRTQSLITEKDHRALSPKKPSPFSWILSG